MTFCRIKLHDKYTQRKHWYKMSGNCTTPNKKEGAIPWEISLMHVNQKRQISSLVGVSLGKQKLLEPSSCLWKMRFSPLTLLHGQIFYFFIYFIYIFKRDWYVEFIKLNLLPVSSFIFGCCVKYMFMASTHALWSYHAVGGLILS